MLRSALKFECYTNFVRNLFGCNWLAEQKIFNTKFVLTEKKK